MTSILCLSRVKHKSDSGIGKKCNHSAMSRRSPTPQEDEAKRDRLVARGRRLVEVREWAGYRTALAAVRAGILDSGTFSNIERGEADMQCLTVEELADGYNVSVDVLLGRAPIPPRHDPFPARLPVLLSPEFERAPAEFKAKFIASRPNDAHSWSTVQWAAVLLRALGAYDALG